MPWQNGLHHAQCSFYGTGGLYTVLYLCGCPQPMRNEWRLVLGSSKGLRYH
jgi:hypothetical protein